MTFLLRPCRGEVYCDQFVCLSISKHISGTSGPSSENFFCRPPVAVAQSSSGGVVIRYVLPVLWMTLRLAVMGRMVTSSVATLGWSLMSMNALLLTWPWHWPNALDMQTWATYSERLSKVSGRRGQTNRYTDRHDRTHHHSAFEAISNDRLQYQSVLSNTTSWLHSVNHQWCQ